MIQSCDNSVIGAGVWVCGVGVGNYTLWGVF